MKSLVLNFILSAALASLALAQTGGSLAPPIGSPSPTYKTLDQVEARTPLVDGAAGVSIDANGTITILAAGSYYLTGNLNIIADAHGILISNNDVTVDLNGFNINGTATSLSYAGVNARGTSAASLTNVTIKNGSIRGFGYSVRFRYVKNSSIHQVSCSNPSLYGIYLDGSNAECSGNSILECSISNSTNQGIYLNGFFGECSGNSISSCSIIDSGSEGIFLYYAEGNTLLSNNIRNFISSGITIVLGSSNRLEENHISSLNTQTNGIRTVNGNKNLILKNSVIGQTDNYLISANDTFGPEVTNSGELSDTGAGSHPWANFSL
ncbi:MAG: right-handed parallel beta-helix repeat-containing protein [Akkermansiaceae bacterium]